MDILELEDLFGAANNRALFGSNDHLNIAALVHSDPEGSTRPLPFLPSERRHDNHPPPPPPLTKTRSLVDVHTSSLTTSREAVNKDEPCQTNNRVVRSQSVFPQFSHSNSSTHHVDIHDVPPEMPIYLLQEDEGNDEEIMRLLSGKKKEPSESDDVIPSRLPNKKNVHLRLPTSTRPAADDGLPPLGTIPDDGLPPSGTMPDDGLPASGTTPDDGLSSETTADDGLPPSRTTADDGLSPTGTSRSAPDENEEITFHPSSLVPDDWSNDLNKASNTVDRQSSSVIIASQVAKMVGSKNTSVVSKRQEEKKPENTSNVQMECIRRLLPLSTVTVCVPSGNNEGTLIKQRYQALPLQSCSPSSFQHTTRKRAHGGGWPKGKSRKIEKGVQLPKLPATGYSIFLSEKKRTIQEVCGSNSMSVLSKHVSKMWSQLSSVEKKVYYDLAEVDHQRYLSELKTHLASTHTAGEESLEKVNEIITSSFATEEDDEVLLCPMCSITFTSLYNKRSHFSGKLHQQELVEQLNKIIATSLSNNTTSPLKTPHYTNNRDHHHIEVSTSTNSSSSCPEVSVPSLCPKVSVLSEVSMSSFCPKVSVSSLRPEVSVSSLRPEVSVPSLRPEVSVPSLRPEDNLATANTVESVARDITQLATTYSMLVGELNTTRKTLTAGLFHHVHLQQTSHELEYMVICENEVLKWLERREQDVIIKIDNIMKTVDKLVTFSCHGNSCHSDEHN